MLPYHRSGPAPARKPPPRPSAPPQRRRTPIRRPGRRPERRVSPPRPGRSPSRGPSAPQGPGRLGQAPSPSRPTQLPRRLPSLPAGARPLALALAGGARAHPYFRAARLAWEAWRWIDGRPALAPALVNPTGWLPWGRCPAPAGPPQVWNWTSLANSATIMNTANNCLGGQARPSGAVNWNNARSIGGWTFTHYFGTSERGQYVVGWTRPTQGPSVPPMIRPIIQPDPYPVGDPEALPILRPVSPPRALPLWPAGGRPPAPRPRPDRPRTARSPVRRPVLGRGVAVGLRPYIEVSPELVPAEPPPQGDREVKFLGSRLLMLTLRAYEGLTEMDDFLDAIWESIPKKLRAKNAGMYQKLIDIRDNYESISITEAVRNLMVNAVEDAVVGRLQGAAGRALRGMQVAPRSQSASDVMLMPRGL